MDLRPASAASSFFIRAWAPASNRLLGLVHQTTSIDYAMCVWALLSTQQPGATAREACGMCEGRCVPSPNSQPGSVTIQKQRPISYAGNTEAACQAEDTCCSAGA